MFPRVYFPGRFFAPTYFPQSQGEQSEVVVVTPGGVFRRLGDLSRVFGRLGILSRAFNRIGDLSRVFMGYPRMADSIQYDTRVKDASETILFVFDFSRFPEAKNGDTLASPVVDPATGLTIGTPTVTTADEIVDTARTVVPAGKGIKVAISGGTAETIYSLECRGTFSGGATRVVKGKVQVE